MCAARFSPTLHARLSELRDLGWNLVVVSSGAIACGAPALGFEARPSDMPSLQACASVGQCALSAAYDEEFRQHGLTTSLVLLTRNDTASRSSYLHARDALTRLVELGVVPVVNENDTVAVDEIRFGDNDTLAALVSCLAGSGAVRHAFRYRRPLHGEPLARSFGAIHFAGRPH